MPPKVKPQISMDETIVEDPELEKILDNRQDLKESVSEYSKLNKEVKGRLSTIETPTPFRIGRFVINRKITPARQVSFEASEGFTFTIKIAGEE